MNVLACVVARGCVGSGAVAVGRGAARAEAERQDDRRSRRSPRPGGDVLAAGDPGTRGYASHSGRTSAPAEGPSDQAGRLPVPRRGRRGALRREGQVAAPARAVVLPARGAAKRAHQIRSCVLASPTVEVIVTGTEVEALPLEQNLVKRHRPPFNVRLRDDKSFPYIAVTRRGRVPAGHVHARAAPPRASATSARTPNAKKVRETLDVLNRVFPFRPCEGPKPGRQSGCRASTTTSSAAGRPASATSSQEQYGAADRRGRRVPRGGDAADPSGALSSGCARRPPRSATRTRRGSATA